MIRHLSTTVVTTVVAAVAVAGLFASTGCGSKSKKATDTTTPHSTATAQTAARPTEVAQGDLRDALLALHRVHFGFDSATLLDEARAAVAEAATKLQKHPTVHVYIDGHSDERGTSEYNIALGEQRARVVLDYLTRSGVAAERLHVISFGEEKPVAAGQGQKAYAQNRRADFRLMRGDIELVVEEGVLYDDKGATIQPSGAPSMVR